MILSNGDFLMVYELDFNQSSLKYVKNVQLSGQRKIVGIQHDRKSRLLQLVSEDGAINFYTDRFMFFQHKVDLIWNKLSAVEFVSCDKLIAGFQGGDIQYVELRAGSETIKDYTVLKFGKSKIVKIKAVHKQAANSRIGRQDSRLVKN